MTQPRATAFAALEAQSLAAQELPATTYQALASAAQQHPQRPALTFLSSGQADAPQFTLTYRKLLGGIYQTANALRALGVQDGDAVTLLLPNLPEYHLLFWGAQVAGVANPVNPLLDATHLIGLMRSANTRVLVTLAPTGEPGLWEKALALAGAVPSLQTIIAIDPYRLMRTSPELPATAVPAAYFHDLLAQQAPTLSFTPNPDPQRVAALFHTGGTTGTPKLAQHTGQNEVFDAWSAGAAVGMTENDVLLCGLPLFHVNGLIVTGLSPLMRGAHVILATAQGYRDPSVLPNFWKLVERHGVTAFSGVPSIYSTLLSVPQSGENLSSLRFAICGAAPMPPALIHAFEARTGRQVLEGYGLTEGTCVSTVNPPNSERKAGSIGVPLPFHGLKVAVLDKGGQFEREAEVDEVGVLLLRGDNVFPGYVEAAHNEGLWVDVAGEQWLNTGDLARVDSDGYFYLAGRRKELIIRGGHNIDPLVIEEALMRHPAVALAAAVGRPDTYAGELPVVYVQLKPETAATDAELLAFAAGHISERPAVPKAVRIVPALPMTGVGKIFKPQLVWEEMRDELTHALTHADIAASVHIGADAGRGVLATVTTQPGHFAEATRVLEAYAVPFTLKEEV